MTDHLENIPAQVELHFSDNYRHFKEFQLSPEYRPYWDKCMEAVKDRELLSHIIFCNDLLHIPPVKTFLLYYEGDFVSITGREGRRSGHLCQKGHRGFLGDGIQVCAGLSGSGECVHLFKSKVFCPYSDLFQESI